MRPLMVLTASRAQKAGVQVQVAGWEPSMRNVIYVIPGAPPPTPSLFHGKLKTWRSHMHFRDHSALALLFLCNLPLIV
jgi:hypothetical protein